MADKLPKFIVLRSVLSDKYASYIYEGEHLGFIYCRQPNVLFTYSKIQVELSKTNSNYVHLRFCKTNRYWGARSYEDNFWVHAISDKPVEDTTNPECTLFEPFFQDDLLFFTHVQSGGSVRDCNDYSMGYRVYLEMTPKATRVEHSFKIVDWDTLVVLPKRVAFKGDNDRFLIAENDYCCFSSGDGNNSHCAFVIEYTDDGHVLVIVESYNRYLRNTHNWIQYDTTDGSGDDDKTLFWPVKIDQNTIALKSKWNNQFCKRLTLDGKENALNAAETYIINEAKIKVEELVLERTIYNVRYRMEDKRIFDEKPFLAGIGSATNASDKDATLAIKIAYETTNSYKFSSSLSIKAGVRTKIQTGVPFIAEGAIEVSVQVGVGFEWEKTTTEKKLAEVLYTVVVPARKKATVNYVGTEGKCSVPFTYTKKDKRSTDGNFVTSVHDDGIFTGVNYYSFRFEELPLESI